MTKSVSQISLPLPEQAGSVEAALATIDFKGVSLPVMQIVLTRLEPEQIAAAIQARFGKNASRFFDNDAAVLDLGKVEAESTDWTAVHEQLSGASLQLVAVYGGNDALQNSARAAGLAVIDAPPVSRASKPKEETPAVEPPATAPQPAPDGANPAAMIVDKPLRSGQRIYAKGGDLVVLAMVSAGAEVIADGNIHIYAPLRGRALAGAQGDAKARIFTTSFEAELVSVAGVYRTFESPQAFGKLAGQPAQISLAADDRGGEPKLQVAALAIR